MLADTYCTMYVTLKFVERFTAYWNYDIVLRMHVGSWKSILKKRKSCSR